jgi:hypothetical protein
MFVSLSMISKPNFKASITEFPTTWIFSVTFSFKRFSLEDSVGTKWKSAKRVVMSRLISSGKGENLLKLLNPYKKLPKPQPLR